MLKPIIEHQKELKEINKKMLFLQEAFNFDNKDVVLEELGNLAKEMKNELEFHFNLQKYGVTNNKVKKFVLENMLVKELLFRMLNSIINFAQEKSIDAFMKLEEFEEIFKAYLKKEKGLFIQQLRANLTEKEIEEIEENLKKLI
jgi:hypothetical protein